MTGIDEFQEYVGRLRDRGLLRRIFVDEAHTVIMDVSYRQKLDQIKGLHRYGCPVIALTATLPGVMVPWFEASMLMRGSTVVRASTVQRNIRYGVVRVTSSGEKTAAGVRVAVVDEVVRVVLRMEKRMSGAQKGVVYVRSRAGCEELAARLGCDYYHSNIVAADERRATLQRWADGEGENRWIVATAGLGTGVDIPGIVGVVHMEQPYGLVDFVQQTGRGGRQAGEVVESVVVMDQRTTWMGAHRSDVAHLNHQAMACFVASSGCRRVAIGMFMDVGLVEAGMDCRQLQAERCDRCRAARRTMVEGEEEEDEEGEEEDEEGEEEDEEGEEEDESRSSETVEGSGWNRFQAYVKDKQVRMRATTSPRGAQTLKAVGHAESGKRETRLG
jgi:superfamily II DNA helicase RecQ